MSQRVTSFLQNQEQFTKRFEKFLDDESFDGLLRRFDYDNSGSLSDEQAARAARVLAKMHTPSAKGFGLLLEVFDFLDVNESQTLEHEELTLAVEILELFCKADSVNDTLSAKEIGMLLTALRSLDTDGNGVLDAKERTVVRDGLWSPDEFLAKLLKA
jgi:Ca2+-binding EF-hand superfamily protein